ncbi:hypothetical protein F5Y19DRAFT_440724 [Xylariaceae sp. FL1651]|nr:hypothetical protein F5Y19DRAFT_440724 [Xylariaceae sp. FL1651]
MPSFSSGSRHQILSCMSGKPGLLAWDTSMHTYTRWRCLPLNHPMLQTVWFRQQPNLFLVWVYQIEPCILRQGRRPFLWLGLHRDSGPETSPSPPPDEDPFWAKREPASQYEKHIYKRRGTSIPVPRFMRVAIIIIIIVLEILALACGRHVEGFSCLRGGVETLCEA